MDSYLKKCYTVILMAVVVSAATCAMDDDGSFLGITWLCFLVVIGVFIAILMYPSVMAGRAKQEKLEKETAEKNRILSDRIFEKCRELNIDPSNASKLGTVAASFGVKDPSEAKRLYKQGQLQKKQAELEKIEANLKRIREQEQKNYQKQKEEADRNGREKYTYIAKFHEKLDLVNHALQEAKIQGARDMMWTFSKEQSWGFWGGIAEGLGGVGAGLATASEIQRQNEKAKEKAHRTRVQGRLALDQAIEEKINYKNTYTSKEKNSVAYIESRLFDNSNIGTKFSNLKVSDVKICVTNGKNFVVQGKIMCRESFELLGKSCVLDGSLRLKIKDKNGTTVGVGYVAAPGGGCLDLSYVGFYNNLTFQSICWVENYSEIDESENYICEIEPYHLWIIEI